MEISKSTVEKALETYWHACAAGPREPAMRAAIEVALAEVTARHEARVTELLAANNAMLAAKRQAEATAEKASDLCARGLRLIELTRERGVAPMTPARGESGGHKIALLDTWTVADLGNLPEAAAAILGDAP